jgi:hypothetical protein
VPLRKKELSAVVRKERVQKRSEERFLTAQADRFIPQKACGMRKSAQERSGKKKRRPAPFGMTVWWAERLAG